jgi:uncharacterized protein (TIGR02118 family)
MYKTLWLLRRNPAMTRDEFIEYYETKHSKFVKDIPGVTKYFRRYPVQTSNLADASDQGRIDFDVVMELWFESEASSAAAFQHVADTIWPDVVEDEKRIFDRAGEGWCTTMIIDIEHETDLSSPTFESTYERGATAAIAE